MIKHAEIIELTVIVIFEYKQVGKFCLLISEDAYEKCTDTKFIGYGV